MLMFTRNSCLILAALVALLVPSSRGSAATGMLKKTHALPQRPNVQPPLTQPEFRVPGQSAIGFPRVESPTPALEIAQTPIDETETEDEMQDRVLGKIARVLARLGHTDRALQLAQSLSQKDVSDRILAAVAVQLAGATQVSEALEIVQRLDTSMQVRVLLNIAKQLNNANPSNLLAMEIWSKALAIAQTLPTPQRKASVFAIAAFNLENPEQAQQMFQWAQTVDDDEEKLDILRNIGQHLARTEQIPKALQLAQTLRTDRERASMILPIVSELLDREQLDRAWETVQLLDDFGAQNDLHASALVTRFAKAGQFSRALELVQKLEDVDLKAETLHKISHQAMAAGKVALAEQTRAEVLALIPAVKGACCRASLQADISLNLVKSGQVAEGLELVGKIEPSYRKVAVLEDIAAYLLDAGNQTLANQIQTEALVVARSISNRNARFNALRKIANRLEAEGQIELARTLHQEAFNGLHAATDSEKADAIANLIRSSYAEETSLQPQEYAQALALLQTMTEEKAKIEVLISLAYRATDLVQHQQLLQIAHTIAGPQQNASMLLAIASSQFAKLQPEQRQEVVTMLLDIAPDLDSSEESASIVLGIVNLLSEPGQETLALQILQKLPDGDRKASAILEPIYYLAYAGKIDRAMQLAETFHDETAVQGAFVAIAGGLIDAGKHEQALQVLERFSDRWLTASVLTRIADRHLEDGKTVKAVEFLDRALALIEQ